MTKVTTKHAEEMLEVLPPRIWGKTDKEEAFQVGEPTSHDDKGRPTYDTFIRNLNSKQWYFAGAMPVLVFASDEEVIMDNPY